MEIKYIHHSEIDKRKWDSCIRQSECRLIYASTTYLDAMSPGWDALMMGDYQIVMPLTQKQKWGIRYLVQPAFVQQLGIFSAKVITSELAEAFLQAAARHFRFAEITMHNETISGQNFIVAQRNNYSLSLSQNHESLTDKYGSIAKKNLKRAANAGLTYESSNDYLPILSLYEERYGKRQPSIKRRDYTHFSQLCSTLLQRNELVVRKVLDAQGKAIAGVVLPVYGNRLYNLVSVITEKGKLHQANYFLYDKLIEEFCGSNFILDFEGSDLPGVASFYEQFAPQSTAYTFVKWNDLPAPMKWLKK